MTYEQKLLTNNNIKLLEPYKGAKLHHMLKCLTCGHEWSATPISKTQTFKKYGVSGCPSCNTTNKQNKRVTHRQSMIESMRIEHGIELTSELSPTTSIYDTQVLASFKNNNCGHEFTALLGNVFQGGVRCSICGKEQRSQQLVNWSKRRSDKWKETATDWEIYKSKVSSLSEQQYQLHKSKINPNDYKRGVAGDPDAYHLDHIVPKRFCFDNDIPADVCAHYTNLQMIHWTDNVGSRSHIKGNVPVGMLKYIPNTHQRVCIDVLRSAFPLAEEQVNIGGVTVALYDKQSNIALSIISLAEPFANTKHLANYRMVTETGTRYIMLFEDEILANQQLVLRKLQHYSGLNTTTRIHARKCTIQIVDSKTKNAFLDQNHIQGRDIANVSLGAFYEDQLVAVMTFSLPRIVLGQRNQQSGIYELSRFATNHAYRIPGIASKLLKNFIDNYPVESIYSYADKRWSVGNVYEQLGFELVSESQPGYFYVVNGERKHRWNYRKDALRQMMTEFDSNLTEYENAQKMGLWRVWDVGNLKYQLTIT